MATTARAMDGDPKKKKRDFFGAKGWGFALHGVYGMPPWRFAALFPLSPF